MTFELVPWICPAVVVVPIDSLATPVPSVWTRPFPATKAQP